MWFKRSAWTVFLLVSAWLAYLGLAEIVPAEIRRHDQLNELETKGIEATAAVTAMREEGRPGNAWRDTDDETLYWITIRFRVGDRDYGSEVQTGLKAYEELEPGSMIRVKYLAEDPDRFYLPEHLH